MTIDEYCDQDDFVILADIQRLSVPDDVLRDKGGWKRVCQVRGRNFPDVKAETWETLCAKRGETNVPRGPY